MLREQIEQTRSTTQRRDQDLSIRVKALEGRIDNVIHQPRSVSESSEVNAPLPSNPSSDPTTEAKTVKPTAPASSGESAGVENEASAFRSAYKVFLMEITNELRWNFKDLSKTILRPH